MHRPSALALIIVGGVLACDDPPADDLATAASLYCESFERGLTEAVSAETIVELQYRGMPRDFEAFVLCVQVVSNEPEDNKADRRTAFQSAAQDLRAALSKHAPTDRVPSEARRQLETMVRLLKEMRAHRPGP